MTNASRTLRAIAAALIALACGCGPGDSSGDKGDGGAPTVSQAATGGRFDASFGNAGIAMADLGTNGGFRAVALQPDGKIVAAGGCYVGGGQQFVVVRFNANGAKDTSFGAGGMATANFGGSYDEAAAVLVQGDGNIVAAGNTYDGNLTSIAVARFKSDGSIDPDFGSAGTRVTLIGGHDTFATGAALAFDGKIVVAGSSGTWPDTDFTVLRYDSSGTLDPSFSGDGIATTSIDGTSTDGAQAVAIQPDGKIVVGGQTTVGFSLSGFAVVRYLDDGSLDFARNLPNGEPDPAYGFGTFGNGISATSYTQSFGNSMQAMALQTDGGIVLAGSLQNGANPDLAVARYAIDGILDDTFRGGGVTTSGLQNVADDARSVALQPDGKIVVVGFDNGAPVIVRLNTDGSSDATFGNQGWFHPEGLVAGLMAVTVQPDGGIVAAGQANGYAMVLRVR